MAAEPFKHGKRTCIFCGGESETKISAEHLWPVWAAGILPASDMHGVLEMKVDSGDKTLKKHKDYRRQGAVNTHRIRTVCRACNNGWMATYEDNVRPFLKNMILGRRVYLGEREHRLLVEYLVYKILTLDAGHLDAFAPPEWASQFYGNRAIPEGLTMFALTCVEGDWQLRYASYGAQIGPDISDRKAPPNIKSFAIGFGSLFVFAILRKQGELNLGFEPGVAIRLWPFLGNEVRWPTLRHITSGQAEYIAASLYRTANGPNIVDLTEIE